MRTDRTISALAFIALPTLALAGLAAREAVSLPSARFVSSGDATPGSRKEDDRPADRDAIRQASREFILAFDKGDAKAIAAQWTENGIYQGENGETVRGRAALEKAYAEHFKSQPKGRIEVEIQSIQFPAKDAAIEEGVLRAKSAGPELPTSTNYRTLLVREDGKWLIAASREWGGDQDKLHDLAWLIGDWVAVGKEGETRLSYEWNEAKTQIRGRFVYKAPGAPPDSGMQLIGLDPVTSQLRSWHFDESGARGEALWNRDGDRWLLDSVGVLPDGVETGAVNFITRVNDDEFVWRSADRLIGGEAAPDLPPVKVTRAKATR